MRIAKRGRPDQLKLFPEQTGQLEMGFDIELEKYIRVGTAIIRIVVGSGNNPESQFLNLKFHLPHDLNHLLCKVRIYNATSSVASGKIFSKVESEILASSWSRI
jgi:hypothetical protein